MCPTSPIFCLFSLAEMSQISLYFSSWPVEHGYTFAWRRCYCYWDFLVQYPRWMQQVFTTIARRLIPAYLPLTYHNSPPHSLGTFEVVWLVCVSQNRENAKPSGDVKLEMLDNFFRIKNKNPAAKTTYENLHECSKCLSLCMCECVLFVGHVPGVYSSVVK